MRAKKWGVIGAIALQSLSLSSMATAHFEDRSSGRKVVAEEPTHPQLIAAKETQRAIAVAEDEVLKIVDEMVKLVDTTNFADLGDEDKFFKSALVTVRAIRIQGQNILALHTRYSESLGKLEDTLKLSVPELRRVSQLFKDYSASETFKDLAEFYVELSTFWTKYSEQCNKRIAQMGPERQEVAESLRFVARSVVLLQRLEAHLDAVGTPKAGANRTAFLNRLRDYVKAFELLRKTMRKVTESISSAAVSDATKASAEKLVRRIDGKNADGSPIVVGAPDPTQLSATLTEVTDLKAVADFGQRHRLEHGAVLKVYRDGGVIGEAVVEVVGELMVRVRTLGEAFQPGDVVGFPPTPAVVAMAGDPQ